MNEFLPRTEPVVPATSATERIAAVVRTVAPASATASRTDARVTAQAARGADAASQSGISVSEDALARAAANQARVHKGVADTLQRLADRPRNDSAALGEAEDSLIALMPQPVVVLPLPPASQEMMEFVSGVTQAIARQAAIARAAQANVSPAMVDAAAA